MMRIRYDILLYPLHSSTHQMANIISGRACFILHTDYNVLMLLVVERHKCCIFSTYNGGDNTMGCFFCILQRVTQPVVNSWRYLGFNVCQFGWHYTNRKDYGVVDTSWLLG